MNIRHEHLIIAHSGEVTSLIRISAISLNPKISDRVEHHAIGTVEHIVGIDVVRAGILIGKSLNLEDQKPALAPTGAGATRFCHSGKLPFNWKLRSDIHGIISMPIGKNIFSRVKY